VVEAVLPQHDAWVRNLPYRWAFLALVGTGLWTLVSIGGPGGLGEVSGGLLAGIGRLMAFIVLPVVVLVFIWGFSERSRLQSAIQQGRAEVDRLIGNSILRNVAKAMAAGVVFGLVTYGLGRFRAYQPWDDTDSIAANVFGVVAFAIVAAPIGFLAGLTLRRALSRFAEHA
jgi:hypothetical protein